MSFHRYTLISFCSAGNMLGAFIEVAQLLDNLHVRHRQLGIQLVQVGNNTTTAEHLTNLDATLVAGVKV
jgi:hypothetical protein